MSSTCQSEEGIVVVKEVDFELPGPEAYVPAATGDQNNVVSQKVL